MPILKRHNSGDALEPIPWQEFAQSARGIALATRSRRFNDRELIPDHFTQACAEFARQLDAAARPSVAEAENLVDDFRTLFPSLHGWARLRAQWNGRTVLSPDGQPVVPPLDLPRMPRWYQVEGFSFSEWSLSTFVALLMIAGLGVTLAPAIPVTLFSVLLGSATIGMEALARKRRADYPVDRNAVKRLALVGQVTRVPTGATATGSVHGEYEAAEASLADLDRAWGDYVLQPEDYYLRRPLLHAEDFPPVQAFRTALLAAQDMIAVLSPTTLTVTQAAELRQAVSAAWLAWDEASRQAERFGTRQMPPSERAAARRCAQLSAIISHPGTSAIERQRAVDEMHMQLRKLATVPARRKDLTAVRELAPVVDLLPLESGRTRPME